MPMSTLLDSKMFAHFGRFCVFETIRISPILDKKINKNNFISLYIIVFKLNAAKSALLLASHYTKLTSISNAPP